MTPEEIATELSRLREHISAELARFEEKAKEREISVFRGLKTFIEDFILFSKGKRDFPQAAFVGLVFAYLRRRGMVLLIGSGLAAGVAGFQVYLLFRQNQIMESQNRLIESQNRQVQVQTEANQLQAVSFLMSSLDAMDPVKAQIAVAQLAEYGSHGVAALARLVAVRGTTGDRALEALFGQHQSHTPDQVLRTLTAWSARHEARLPPPGLAETSDWSKADAALLEVDMGNSRDYFEGLTKRFEKEPTFRAATYELVRAEPFFLDVIAATHFFGMREALKLGAAIEDGPPIVDWHHTVYVFCRTLAGHKGPFDEVDYWRGETWDELATIVERGGIWELDNVVDRWLDYPLKTWLQKQEEDAQDR